MELIEILEHITRYKELIPYRSTSYTVQDVGHPIYHSASYIDRLCSSMIIRFMILSYTLYVFVHDENTKYPKKIRLRELSLNKDKYELN